MTENDMHDQIKKKVYVYMGQFYEKYLDKTRYFIGFPEIGFDELPNVAQCTWEFKDTGYCDGLIQFNKLNIVDNFETYMNHIVGHEVCHWCTALLHGASKNDDNEGHKEVFVQIMEFFGLDINNELPSFHYHAIKGMHQYKCGCSTLNFDNEEHSEAQKFGAECETCNQDYVYHGENK